MAKLFWSEYHKRLGEVAIGIEGSDGLLRPDGEATRSPRGRACS